MVIRVSLLDVSFVFPLRWILNIILSSDSVFIHVPPYRVGLIAEFSLLNEKTL